MMQTAQKCVQIVFIFQKNLNKTPNDHQPSRAKHRIKERRPMNPSPLNIMTAEEIKSSVIRQKKGLGISTHDHLSLTHDHATIQDAT